MLASSKAISQTNTSLGWWYNEKADNRGIKQFLMEYMNKWMGNIFKML